MSTMTIKDIARICNVSTSTVSRAIRNDSGINKETREKILQVVEENNYIPNNNARSLKELESNTIALLIKGMGNPFFQTMLAHYEKEIKKQKYSFMIHTVGDDEDELEVALQLQNEKKLKGIIFLGGLLRVSDDIEKKLKVPFVRCTAAVEKGSVPPGTSIAIDDFAESYRVVDYLCKMGHQRIAIITTIDQDNSVGLLRQEGYLQALRDNGLEPDKNLMRLMDERYPFYSIENGYHTTKKLLEEGVDFTALFATSDIMSLGAYKAIYEAEKRIPEDYSVVGFDGITMANYYHPTLTTLRQPMEEMVKASMDQLMKAIRQEETERVIFFPGILIEGQSVKRIERS